jgi:hypothetical protein
MWMEVEGQIFQQDSSTKIVQGAVGRIGKLGIDSKTNDSFRCGVV